MKSTKRVMLCASILLSALTFSCKKEEVVSQSSIHNNQDVVSVNQQNIIHFKNQNEYEKELEKLKGFFSSKETKKKNVSSNEQQLSKTLSAEEARSSFIKTHTDKYERFVTKFPEFRNIPNLLSSYTQLLQKNDLAIWKNAAAQYPNRYSYSNDLLFLKHTDLLSALIDEKGVFAIDNNIYVYQENGVKIISNGDAQLIEVNEESEHVKYAMVNNRRGYSTYSKGDLIHNNYLAKGIDYKVNYHIKKDYIMMGDGCIWAFSVYGQVEGLFYQKVNQNWFLMPAQQFTGNHQLNADGSFYIKSSTSHNSFYVSAGGHYGCFSSNSYQMGAYFSILHNNIVIISATP